MRFSIGALGAITTWLFVGCGSPTEPPPVVSNNTASAGGSDAPTVREMPPESGPTRDIAFPQVTRTVGARGLELNVAEWHQLPIVYARLVIRSGTAADPENRPGLADLVGQMLKEGTRTRSSAEIAEEVAFLGADFWVESDEETVTIGMRALSEHLDQMMALLADVAMNSSFKSDELNKLKRRERNRLRLSLQDPNYLARREFYRHLYGEHPYAHVDTTLDVLDSVRRNELVRWHRRHFVANNAALIVVGDVSPEQAQRATESAFGRWRRGNVPEPEYAEVPVREATKVVVVNRPESVQSVILIGNLALDRASDDYLKLQVANQVLGGSAASRLFMDLRERRGLTYGAYSAVGERVHVGPFQARAAVRTEVTLDAMTAFFEHLSRIVAEAPPPEELLNAHRYLSDSFPLQIDTPGKIAWLIGKQRIFGLADDYWDSYRSSVRSVTSEEALSAAQQYIQPDQELIVVVGKSADFAESLRRFGAVTVIDPEGTVQQELTMHRGDSPPEASLPATTSEAEDGAVGASSENGQ